MSAAFYTPSQQAFPLATWVCPNWWSQSRLPSRFQSLSWIPWPLSHTPPTPIGRRLKLMPVTLRCSPCHPDSGSLSHSLGAGKGVRGAGGQRETRGWEGSLLRSLCSTRLRRREMSRGSLNQT